MSKEIKHTEGPWHVPFDHPAVVQNAVGQAVADTDSNVYIAFGAKEANARLIAAAPELLQVCRAIAGSVKFSESEHPERTEHAGAIMDGWIEACRKLVAKAQGGAK